MIAPTGKLQRLTNLAAGTPAAILLSAVALVLATEGMAADDSATQPAAAEVAEEIVLGNDPPSGKKPEFRLVLRSRISGKLLKSLVSRKVSQTDPIDEIINGRLVQGSTDTTANAEVQLAPNKEKGEFNYAIRGTTESSTTTFANIVQVHGVGNGSFEKDVRILLTDRGIDIYRGEFQYSAESCITGISTPFGPILGTLIRRFALQRALQEKDEFDRVSREKQAASIEQRIESSLNRANDKLRQVFGVTVNQIQQKRAEDAAVEKLLLHCRFKTTENRLTADFLLAGDGGKTNSKPPCFDKSAPFVVHIHSSLLATGVANADDWKRFVAPIRDEIMPGQDRELSVDDLRELFKKRAVPDWKPLQEWTTVYVFPTEQEKLQWEKARKRDPEAGLPDPQDKPQNQGVSEAETNEPSADR